MTELWIGIFAGVAVAGLWGVLSEYYFDEKEDDPDDYEDEV